MEGEARQAYDFTKELQGQVIEWATGDPDLTDMDREAIVCSANALGASVGVGGERAGRWTHDQAKELLTPHTSARTT